MIAVTYSLEDKAVFGLLRTLAMIAMLIAGVVITATVAPVILAACLCPLICTIKTLAVIVGTGAIVKLLTRN